MNLFHYFFSKKQRNILMDIDAVKVLFLQEVKKNPNHHLGILVSDHDAFKYIFDKIKYKERLSNIIPQPDAFCEMKKGNGDPLKINFPEPTGININMMPIVLRWREYLPDYLKGYYNMIDLCVREQIGVEGVWEKCYEGKWIGYLTIQESIVEPGETQRRPGLHIESPLGKGRLIPQPDYKKVSEEEYHNSEWKSIAWGTGRWSGTHHADGIYMASNTENSTKLYPYLVENSEKVTDIHGGLEEYQNDLEGEIMKKDTMYWFTDKTPHESLPNLTDKPVYRQFFRLVVGPIGVWYSQHNTPNPLGVQPETLIVDTNKFN